MTQPNRYLSMPLEQLLNELPSSVHPASNQVTQPLAAILILSVREVSGSLGQLAGAITEAGRASDRLARVGVWLNGILVAATIVMAVSALN